MKRKHPFMAPRTYRQFAEPDSAIDPLSRDFALAMYKAQEIYSNDVVSRAWGAKDAPESLRFCSIRDFFASYLAITSI